MQEEIISVIVPVYNVEMYLSACLDSILTQSYRNLEVIIINDGSTDFSLKIAEKYSESDDRVIVYSYENAGLSEARNRGLSVATGKYVTFVDSDDLLLQDSIKVMYDELKKYQADIVEGKIIRGKIIDHNIKTNKIKSEIFTVEEAISNVLYQKKLLPSACGKLYRKELFDSFNFEKGILYEDLNIFYKILSKCSKIVWLDYTVYFYRDTEGSIVNTWKSQRLDVLKVTENLENYISEVYPGLLPAAKDRRLSANFNMFALCSINGDHQNAKKCWEHIKKNRNQSLFNSKVRFKNKAGILLSYFGKNIFSITARRFYS
ncbi:MAG: glycosyltransferase family 2 protein [Muribaculaceae bacterium]|nr:glycosyltransferase family 2 protein [Muribaculaceae bacterium]